MIGEDAIDLPRLSSSTRRADTGTQTTAVTGWPKSRCDALRKNQKFGCDRFEFVVFVFGDDKYHLQVPSLPCCSFSTRVAAASSGVPVMISTRLFRSGMRISMTSYIAPAFRPSSQPEISGGPHFHLLFRRHDALQRRVSRLIDAELNGQHGRHCNSTVSLMPPSSSRRA